MKYRKKSLLQTIDLFDRVNGVIENFSTDLHEYKYLIEALTDCQAAAIEMGTYIETLEKTGVSIVRMLEEYCEDIYQQSINLDKADLCKKISKKIRKELNNIRNAIKFELSSEKKEVVFLPYNASMWDSLESVWMAARDDDRCDVYVIPIPYFDKNSDDSFGKMHYEGDKYPDYVPITDWNEYSLEEHMPDIIYIHNPYDNDNLITSVHPMFYSEELRKYTDMLVYIPYFIGINNKVESHFCVLPGTIYADRVILESEEIRQIYIDEFKKFEKENDCKGAFGNPNEKFLALGSPKIEKIRSVKKENLNIPEEWSNILRKPDGEYKKVVFYNTGLKALLSHGEDMLCKWEHVFGVFKKNKDEIALLWRPHPLLFSTIQTMRPNLLDRYCKIVEQYRSDNWGIYDDGSDFEMAACISDIYYGDQSSVTEIFAKTGKTVIIQNVEFGEENCVVRSSEKAPLFFDNVETWACANGKIYTISERVLYEIDIETDDAEAKVEAICDFKNAFGENNSIVFVYDMEVINDKLYFFARTSVECGIIMYDFQKKLYEVIRLDTEEVFIKDDYLSAIKFSFMFSDSLYFISFRVGMPIVRIMLADNKVSYINGWDDELKIYLEKQDELQTECYGFPTVFDDKVLISTTLNKIIVEYSLSTGKSIVHYNKDENSEKCGGLKSMSFDGTECWMTLSSLYGSYISKLNHGYAEEMRIKGVLEKFPKEASVYDYSFCIYANGFIWVFQRYSSDIVKINATDYSVIKINIVINENPESRRKQFHFLVAKKYGNDIFAYNCKGHVMVRLNTLTDEVSFLYFSLSIEYGSRQWAGVIRKRYGVGVRAYFNAENSLENDDKEQKTGMSIHNYVMGEL